ncbi:MAG: L-rhamnose mutarotase [Anaerolineales bacterium]|nr:L-rhamnose mutarotase [Anaerolineales bacterium]
MLRRAFILRLKDNSLAEYTYHHDNFWPEMVEAIERSGIASITILRKTHCCFSLPRFLTKKPGSNYGPLRFMIAGPN